MRLIFLLSVFAIFVNVHSRVSLSAISGIRGGIVPEVTPDGEYYEKFKLDYGCDDSFRTAGRMTGLLKYGKISSLFEPDPFFKWLNAKLEKGPQPPTERYKPYYAADFGKKVDLKWGENPKIIIVNRKLAAASNGTILKPPMGAPDVEVREVWQPWLRSKCDFVVRYIVPNRGNIIEIMEGQGRFHQEISTSLSSLSTVLCALQLHFGKAATGGRTATAHMVFRPTWWQRLQGHTDIVMKRALDARRLFDELTAGQEYYRKMTGKDRRKDKAKGKGGKKNSRRLF